MVCLSFLWRSVPRNAAHQFISLRETGEGVPLYSSNAQYDVRLFELFSHVPSNQSVGQCSLSKIWILDFRILIPEISEMSRNWVRAACKPSTAPPHPTISACTLTLAHVYLVRVCCCTSTPSMPTVDLQLRTISLAQITILVGVFGAGFVAAMLGFPTAGVS